MSIPLHVLFVEDSIPDMEEMLHILKKDGFAPQWQRVDGLDELHKALQDQAWDVILSDHRLPGFGSLEALQALRGRGFDTPFIIVSGVVDDETAILAMKAGASDFLKKDRLSRLASAIRRELDESILRRQHALTRNQLQEVEERFRMMVETARDYAIFMLDPEGRVISWNIGAQRMFGYTPGEAMGLPLTSLYPAQGAIRGNDAAAALAIAASSGHYEEEDLRWRPSGTVFWVHAVVMPIKHPNGELRGFSCITRDIDRQKRADQALIERKNLTNLFQQTSAILAIASGPEHILEFANPAFLRLLEPEPIGKALNLAHPRLRDLQSILNKVLIKDTTEEVKEFQFGGSDDRHFFDLIISARRNAQDQIDGVMILGSDVTEQLQARKAAEASNASKSAFLANMSHEIRTPLGAILGFSDLLMDHTLSVDDRRRYVDTINRNSKALTRIIDDILDLAKIEAGRLDIEEMNFSLSDLMDDVIGMFKEKARQKGIFLHHGFDSQIPSMICSDPTRLRQILFNIIGNAIKFTDQGGVSVFVGLQNRSDRSLRIVVDVKDSGHGISESQKQKLFQPFTQADNTTTRQFGGTGLGLALSKRLCEALGGSIAITSTDLMKGSHFTISFQASTCQRLEEPAPHRIARAIESNDPPLKNLRVLVVDDVLDNQVLLIRYLTKCGALVDVANDGSEGVEKAMSQIHDLILMDIQMPKMDGYQAIRALMAQGYKKPIVAVTAHALLEERRKTEAAGFAGHLTKPFDRDELISTVSNLTLGSVSSIFREKRAGLIS